MSRTPFDEFAKQLLEQLLSPLGEVNTSREVPGESRWVDVWFSPAARSPTASIPLGLLGQIRQLIYSIIFKVLVIAQRIHLMY
jgi:hypothetical protein